MLGMVGNKVESVKIIGRRDMKMDTNMRALFDEMDYIPISDSLMQGVIKPYFNDAKELFRIFWIYLRETADNEHE